MTPGLYKIKQDHLKEATMLQAEVKQQYIDGKLVGCARAKVDDKWTGWAPVTWFREQGWNSWVKEGK